MATERSATWRWGVCGLLLLAAMLMYMDRLTLSQLAATITREYALSNEQFGLLTTGFSLAFASGALFFGVLVDRIGPRWLYPTVLVGWSAAGVLTAYSQTIGAWFIPDDPALMPSLAASTIGMIGADPLAATVALTPDRTQVGDQAYFGFMLCRIMLGFFEAGHWPCALVTTRIILSRGDRTLGNGILQSGASLGSILTPFVVLPMVSDELGGWRPPFTTIGYIGMLWVIPWLLVVRPGDLDRTSEAETIEPLAEPAPKYSTLDLLRMIAALVIVVITINLTWQYFSNWLPKYLQETHRYTRDEAGWFTSGYYVSAEIGCLAIGFIVKAMIHAGWEVHRARLVTFCACAALTLLAVAVAYLDTGPLLLLVLLCVAAGSLGFYPNYYSFTQELTRKHQGKVSGALGTVAWIGGALMQWLVGRNIDETRSYANGIIMAGLMPILACAALWLLWPSREAPPPEAVPPAPLPEPASTAIKAVDTRIRDG
jgi:ACS family hexuronate transporter-like MFS transporter